MANGKQPPSGGCVLKQLVRFTNQLHIAAATFRWLCVETEDAVQSRRFERAATFRWLCVETHNHWPLSTGLASSHLQVAVC